MDKNKTETTCFYYLLCTNKQTILKKSRYLKKKHECKSLEERSKIGYDFRTERELHEKMEDESATNSHDSICPICLGPLTQESYLDHCLHRFCFNCILRWTNVVSSKHQTPPSSVKCPLCKVRLFPSLFNSYNYCTLIYYADFVIQTDNFSIIYGLDGTSFQRHYINTNLQDWFVVSLTMPLLIIIIIFFI